MTAAIIALCSMLLGIVIAGCAAGVQVTHKGETHENVVEYVEGWRAEQ